MPSTIDQNMVRNRLLSALDRETYGRLQPHLTLRSLPMREVLTEPGQRIESICFPETGLVSFVSPTDVETEVGIVGQEGFVGAFVILGVERSPLKIVSQISGESLVVPTEALLEAARASSAFMTLLTRYTHVFMMQAASTAYANAHFTVEQRLARWLLMMHDRVDGDELDVTHEFLAVMLCVRRPGVTVATHILEGNGLIRAKRGRITILDREKLMALAGDSYGLAEAEYDHLITPRIGKADLKHAV